MIKMEVIEEDLKVLELLIIVIGKTKKILVLLLCLFFLVSCEEKLTEKELQTRQEKREMYKGFDVIEIDSCEYLIKLGGQRTIYGLMSHKGNCKYCEERNKKNKIK